MPRPRLLSPAHRQGPFCRPKSGARRAAARAPRRSSGSVQPGCGRWAPALCRPRPLFQKRRAGGPLLAGDRAGWRGGGRGQHGRRAAETRRAAGRRGGRPLGRGSGALGGALRGAGRRAQGNRSGAAAQRPSAVVADVAPGLCLLRAALRRATCELSVEPGGPGRRRRGRDRVADTGEQEGGALPLLGVPVGPPVGQRHLRAARRRRGRVAAGPRRLRSRGPRCVAQGGRGGGAARGRAPRRPRGESWQKWANPGEGLSGHSSPRWSRRLSVVPGLQKVTPALWVIGPKEGGEMRRPRGGSQGEGRVDGGSGRGGKSPV